MAEQDRTNDICYKVHKQEGHILVAACDAELVGTTIEHQGRQLEVTASFYCDQKGSAEELARALMVCTMANLLGSRTVKAAVECGVVEEGCVLLLGDVPHAQVYKI